MNKFGVCPVCQQSGIPVYNSLSSKAMGELADEMRPTGSLNEFIDEYAQWTLSEHTNHDGKICIGTGQDPETTYNSEVLAETEDYLSATEDTNTIPKGTNPQTEHYGAFRPS